MVAGNQTLVEKLYNKFHRDEVADKIPVDKREFDELVSDYTDNPLYIEVMDRAFRDCIVKGGFKERGDGYKRDFREILDDYMSVYNNIFRRKEAEKIYDEVKEFFDVLEPEEDVVSHIIHRSGIVPRVFTTAISGLGIYALGHGLSMINGVDIDLPQGEVLGWISGLSASIVNLGYEAYLRFNENKDYKRSREQATYLDSFFIAYTNRTSHLDFVPPHYLGGPLK